MSYSFTLFCQPSLTWTRSFAAIQSALVPSTVNVNVSQLTPSTQLPSSVTPPGLIKAPFHVPFQPLAGPPVPIEGGGVGVGVGVGVGGADVTWITTCAPFALVRPAE